MARSRRNVKSTGTVPAELGHVTNATAHFWCGLYAWGVNRSVRRDIPGPGGATNQDRSRPPSWPYRRPGSDVPGRLKPAGHILVTGPLLGCDGGARPLERGPRLVRRLRVYFL